MTTKTLDISDISDIQNARVCGSLLKHLLRYRFDTFYRKLKSTINNFFIELKVAFVSALLSEKEKKI